MTAPGGIRFGKPKTVPTDTPEESGSEATAREGFRLRSRTAGADTIWDKTPTTSTSVNPVILIAAVMAPILFVALIASKGGGEALGFDNKRVVERYEKYRQAQLKVGGATGGPLPTKVDVERWLFKIAQLENAGETDRAKFEWALLLRETGAVPDNPLLELGRSHVR